MKVIETEWVSLFNAGAITVWPFIFVHPRYAQNKRLMVHERVHAEQQKRWFKYGLGVGLLFWHFLYLLCLPVGWNYFRDKWEREAYKEGQGYTDKEIDSIMRSPPYYLWWM